MGLFKILGGVVLGVGAVAAAPFTGGGSIFGAATLIGSLTGAGAIATAAGVAGGVAGAVISDKDEDNRRKETSEAHESGFKQGIKKGNMETAEKFDALLRKNDNCRIGVFALAVCVANKDNDFSVEEREEIERYLGRPDSVVNKNVRDEFLTICNKVPSFDEVKSKYLDHFFEGDLKELNNFVLAIIEADGIISHEERSFIDHDWNPYLKERGVA